MKSLFQIVSIFLTVACLAGAMDLDNLCTKAGVFPHPTDCRVVVTCQGSEMDGFVVEQHMCPEGKAYSQNHGACVDFSQVPECQYTTLAESDPLCANQPVHCKDCKTMIVCSKVNGVYVKPVEVPCTSSTPYCDASLKACTNSLPNGCPLPGFVCTGPGYFPDPKNCSIYHICFAEDKYESHRCPPKYYYDSVKFLCEPIKSPTDCVVANCPAGYIGLNPYPKNPKYYVFCIDKVAEIFQCEGNLEFVDASKECKFVCRAEGQFVNIEDCHKYHLCTATASPGKFILTEEKCPGTLVFNPVSRRCDLSECQVPGG